MKWISLNTEEKSFNTGSRDYHYGSKRIALNPEYIESVIKRDNGKAEIRMEYDTINVEETFEEVMALLWSGCRRL